MRLRHIEIFQAIRQAGSISGAAQLLHVSQPSVTKVLQHAEAQLGFALFQRIKGKLVITPEALALEREVSKVTVSLDGVRRLAESLRREPGQTLRIGATPTLASSLLPALIGEWCRRFPDTSCELASLHSHELVQNLFMREIDVALTFQHPEHPGLEVRPVAQSFLVVLAPKDYWPSPEIDRPLMIDALADAPLIGLSHTDPLFAQLDLYLAGINPPPRTAIRVQTYSLARALVESGAGLAIVDPFTALEGSPERKTIRKLVPPLPVTLYMMTRANEPNPHILESLNTLLKQQVLQLLATIKQ
ncbi:MULTISPECIES: LysR substrate-binding domain-containing protein [unclassified Pseudomonas]|uniref:LysR family transcriptional regulator n=1 Tax=unclassified Pseudomonas TaxID=196821 RepID=UPI002AC9B4B1|nr:MULTISPECIES: LysR substrate-binding domain-containing protein [unclassified Pseudomonas]MEB0042586.1 LysR substrate-binding domain-containing protein [Pseudomonas sp. MH10]MEB0077282.1 LysR substrate-binding domain-containing protein [Pseudomonas sp. MH10out]MEB0091387.1 LysR substrate-binding domain-containing protein [Pseudomonas sp. CCI4.2]MEB0104480.1 LysR substrate-binding domain-containing protein [Pseudomonas sp. CCI3.2]MEB0120735.1 LysR substrate-binding domain-containing protein [